MKVESNKTEDEKFPEFEQLKTDIHKRDEEIERLRSTVTMLTRTNERLRGKLDRMFKIVENLSESLR